MPPLAHITLGTQVYDETEHIVGDDGKGYEVGYADDDQAWFAITSDDLWNDFVVRWASSEQEALTLLDKAVGQHRKRKDPALYGSESNLNHEFEARDLSRDLKKRAAVLQPYGDKRKREYDREVAGFLKNYRDDIDDPEYAQEWIEKAEARIKTIEGQREARNYQQQQLEARRARSVASATRGIKPGDTVKITNGTHKGKFGTVVSVGKQNTSVRIDGKNRNIPNESTEYAVAQQEAHEKELENRFNKRMADAQQRVEAIRAAYKVNESEGSREGLPSAVAAFEAHMAKTNDMSWSQRLTELEKAEGYLASAEKLIRYRSTAGNLNIPSNLPSPQPVRKPNPVTVNKPVVKKSVYRDKYEGSVQNLLKTVQQKKTLLRLLDHLEAGRAEGADRELLALKNQVSKDGARPGIVTKFRNIEKDIASMRPNARMEASMISTNATINLVMSTAVANELQAILDTVDNPGFDLPKAGKGRLIVVKDKDRVLQLLDNQIDIVDDQNNYSLKRALRAFRKKVQAETMPQAKDIRNFVRDSIGRFAEVPGSGGPKVRSVLPQSTPDLKGSHDWIRSHTVEVKAGTLRKGDGILFEDSGLDVHEVMDAQHRAGQTRLHTRNTRTGEERTQAVKSNSIFKKVLLALSALAMLAGLGMGGMHAANRNDHDAPVHQDTTSQVQRTLLNAPDIQKHVPAPTTAKGYADMWSQIDPAEWGGADVSISVPLKDGRSVWLYGDTLSGNNGFVHSTAIVQDGGTLHVSHGGAQLLPNDDAQHIYWVEDAHPVGPNKIAVDASPMQIGNKSVWDFHRTRPEARRAIVTVDAQGNVTFDRWKGYVKGEPIEPAVKILGPNHYAYGQQAHPELKLASGKVLYTVSQNWDDSFDNHKNPDGSLRYEDWRPMFHEGPMEGMK
jgi:ribosomal protein L24